jgi:hypothetical protein
MQSGLALALAGAIDSPRISIRTAKRGVERRFMAASEFRSALQLGEKTDAGLPPVLIPG